MSVTAISAVVLRQRTTVAGHVTHVASYGRPWMRFEVELSDGSGRITLCFVGRSGVPGIVPGCQLVAQGTPALDRGRLLMRNPLYTFGVPGDQGS
jgi:hypothetical protein